jgi:hypothetical protein
MYHLLILLNFQTINLILAIASSRDEIQGPQTGYIFLFYWNYNFTKYENKYCDFQPA